MTFRAVIIALILVQAEVELSTMLNHCNVERREQNVVFVIELRHGHNEQTMILARVAIYDGRTSVSSRTIRSQQFTTQ